MSLQVGQQIVQGGVNAIIVGLNYLQCEFCFLLLFAVGFRFNGLFFRNDCIVFARIQSDRAANGRDAIQRCDPGFILIVLVFDPQIKPHILVAGMDHRNVAGYEYNTGVLVVTGDGVFDIAEFFFCPAYYFLMKCSLTQFGLAGVGIADIVFGIKRKTAVLCECGGCCGEQQEQKEMFQGESGIDERAKITETSCRTGTHFVFGLVFKNQ